MYVCVCACVLGRFWPDAPLLLQHLASQRQLLPACTPAVPHTARRRRPAAGRGARRTWIARTRSASRARCCASRSSACRAAASRRPRSWASASWGVGEWRRQRARGRARNTAVQQKLAPRPVGAPLDGTRPRRPSTAAGLSGVNSVPASQRTSHVRPSNAAYGLAAVVNTPQLRAARRTCRCASRACSCGACQGSVHSSSRCCNSATYGRLIIVRIE